MKSSQLISGLHSVRSALEHNPGLVLEIWAEDRRNDRRMREMLSLAAAADILVQTIGRQKLDTMAGGVVHQGVIARVRIPPALGENALKTLLAKLDRPPLLLVLDGVQDPHNLGACLRSADAAGADAVIAPKDRAAGLTPTARKVASGAAESVPFIQVTNLSRTLKWLKQDQGVWLIGTASEGSQDIYDADLTGAVCIIMGGEEQGMRRLTREHCDLLVRLPMHGRVESLNVSVASGICMYEVIRQRRQAVHSNPK